MILTYATVNISGGGSANPPKFSIPGHIKADDPGYNVNIYNSMLPSSTSRSTSANLPADFNSYTLPGPAVWRG